jgi:hypothetical protein
MQYSLNIAVYSQTVRSPLDAVDPEHNFDEWEFVLYLMTTSFLIEGKSFTHDEADTIRGHPSHQGTDLTSHT